jgi:hypothetical protein
MYGITQYFPLTLTLLWVLRERGLFYAKRKIRTNQKEK